MPTQYRTRADLAEHPLFSHLENDSDGNPCVYRNRYECHAGHDAVIWHDVWSSACDDECPVCGQSYAAEPEWIGPADVALAQLWEMLPDASGHDTVGIPSSDFVAADEDHAPETTFSGQESAHLLAALRLWQRITSDVDEIPETVVATAGGEYPRMTRAELNRLCRMVGGAA